jgi:hypothetical protein
LKAPFADGEVAITLVKPDSGTPVPSGSMSFAGNALAFHTLNGDPFTVTYTVAAMLKSLLKEGHKREKAVTKKKKKEKKKDRE